MRVSLIVPQIEFRLLEFLEKKFADDLEIVIIRDRRSAQPRRRRPSLRNQERRRTERRGRNRENVGTFFLMRDDSAP
ncbi:MAG TPA: hypothetical protein VML54_03165 [Candidatus Limnocylindrales bacterium]|nr:hypothetical protein [Candidatus Limnocylindrales bacterium]